MDNLSPLLHCCMCGEFKPRVEFREVKKSRDGKQAWCKDCGSKHPINVKRLEYIKQWQADNPEKTRRNKYNYKLKKRGLKDYDEYLELLDQQGNVCKICGCDNPAQWNTNMTFFSVDHCHKTGKVRGLLCDRCNNGIARFLEDPDLLRKAVEYLESAG